MDNEQADVLRAMWHEGGCSDSMEQLLGLVLEYARYTARRYVDADKAQEIAQETAMHVWEHIYAPVNWERYVANEAEKRAKRLVRKLTREAEGKERLMEHNENKGGRTATESIKGQLRDFVVDALTPREWQIIHAKYWNNDTSEAIAQRIGLSKRHVDRLHADALDHLREAFRRLGICKANWKEYYYE